MFINYEESGQYPIMNENSIKEKYWGMYIAGIRLNDIWCDNNEIEIHFVADEESAGIFHDTIILDRKPNKAMIRLHPTNDYPGLL